MAGQHQRICPVTPVLYSFRRCPYAIRARLAVAASRQQVVLREVVLRDKPQAMLDVSGKGTVPVLVLESGTVLDESLDIMRWALERNDPLGWLENWQGPARWIAENDGAFKHWLDRYKYADRYPEGTAQDYRQQGQVFLTRLDQHLATTAWLNGNQPGVDDIAVFPFVRQFAAVDPAWFARSPYPALQAWLQHWLDSEVFASVMRKYPQWQPADPETFFPD